MTMQADHDGALKVVETAGVTLDVTEDPQITAWREDIARVQERVDQWNPHSPTMMPRIEGYGRSLQGLRDRVDTMQQRVVREGRALSDLLSTDQIEQMDETLERLSADAGVPRPRSKSSRMGSAHSGASGPPSRSMSAAAAEHDEIPAPEDELELG